MAELVRTSRGVVTYKAPAVAYITFLVPSLLVYRSGEASISPLILRTWSCSGKRTRHETSKKSM
ncbi:hypothetical protein T439DRAFT_327611 [Meredithblackwellia eburnea MCA 4105]